MVFVVKAKTCRAKNKAGKALITLPEWCARVTAENAQEPSKQDDWLAAVTNEGRLLVFKVSDLPQLSKGKEINRLAFQLIERLSVKNCWWISRYYRRKVTWC